MANMRSGGISTLAHINDAKNYLEVGVCKGLTFPEIEIENKDAVDPYFAGLPSKASARRGREMVADKQNA